MTGLLVHASCVSVEGRGLLIRGASGSGKSGLALQLMALGAGLVADDQVLLRCADGQVLAQCPDALSGLIEARGIGLLRAGPVVGKAAIALVVDLDQTETERLPPARQCDLLGIPVDLVHRSMANHFASALICYLKYGRHA